MYGSRMTSLPRGWKVVVSELGERPLDAVENHTSLVPMDPPDVATLAPVDVVIAVKSASVGWVDLLMTSGQYQHLAKPPYVPGLESAGVVVAKGPEAGDAIAIGDAVLVDPFLAGPRSLGAYRPYGGFASYVVAPASAALRIPGALDFDRACNLLGNYETAYHALIARGRLRAGETVLIHGASGSTGLAAVHVAKLAIVREQGADHVVRLGGAESMRDAVKALTGGSGVDVVYDGVGGDVSLESLRCVKFGARFLIVGWASTPFVARGKGERGAPNANQLPTNLVLMKGLDVLGAPTAIATAHDPSIRAPRLAQVLRWAEEGKIRPYVSRTFPLAEYREAMRAKWNGEIVGGATLHP